jgi:two-component system NtrC family sensor kinase
MLVGASDVEPVGLLQSEPLLNVGKGRLRGVTLALAMVASVAAVAALAYWDAARESTAALQDFAEEQRTIAAALSAALRVRSETGAPIEQPAVLKELRSIERERTLAIYLHRAGEDTLRSTEGTRLSSGRLIDAITRGDAVLRVPREEAAAFGLPARTALAGISRVAAGPSGSWEVIAIATAQRVRDREFSARRRLMLSVFLAAGLVLAFGGGALRMQRSELVLARELAVQDLRQRRDERLERANRAAAMGALAMGVAHEISTPLGVIAGRAEQMSPRVAGDERLSGDVGAILSQVDRINQVIRGLLGLARGDAPAAERIDPRQLVRNAVGLVEHRFGKAGVQLRESVAGSLPTINGDPRLLEHAIVNLLLNAFDACKDDGEVLIGVARRDAELEIAVEDSGTGISPSDAGRALEPFFTTKAREGGTGLGLAIAHEIVASHGGRLAFSTLAPRGTRAAIVIPAAEGEAHA